METGRKLLAIIVGIFILALIILAARFLGQKVQEKYFTPKQIVTQNLPLAPLEPTNPSLLETGESATISAIPSTGPEDVGFIIMGLMFLSGVSSLALAKNR